MDAHSSMGAGKPPAIIGSPWARTWVELVGWTVLRRN